jgi:hypothetical protein
MTAPSPFLITNLKENLHFKVNIDLNSLNYKIKAIITLKKAQLYIHPD